MDTYDPTAPLPYIRNLPSSQNGSLSNPDGTAVRSISVTVPVQFRPVPFIPAAALGVPPLTIRIVQANASRKSLVLRVLGGDATTVLGLVTADWIAGGSGNAYMPILNGETLTLDYAGELWVSKIAGSIAAVYATELIAAQSS